MNYNNLSTAISELGEWGYLVRQSHPLNRRRHIYRIRYDTSLPARAIDAAAAPRSRRAARSNPTTASDAHEMKREHAAPLPDDLGAVAQGAARVRVARDGYTDRNGQVCQRGRIIRIDAVTARRAAENCAVEILTIGPADALQAAVLAS